MKGTDKFLLRIVAGIVLLVAVAFVVALTRSEPTYQAEDTPEDVVHNYLLALKKGDYERAYGYLSPTIEGYPASADAFTEDVEDSSWRFRFDPDTTVAVESASVTGNRAVVDVPQSRFSGGDLFDSDQYTTVFEMRLQLKDGEWKIVDSDYYFLQCWRDNDGCE